MSYQDNRSSRIAVRVCVCAVYMYIVLLIYMLAIPDCTGRY